MEYGWTEKKKTGIAAAVIVLLLILIGLFSLQIKTVTKCAVYSGADYGNAVSR